MHQATPLHRTRHILLAISMLLMGGCGMIYEYILSMMGNYLLGSSYEEIFIIIGIMMFAMGVGSFVQQHLRQHLLDWFLLLETALGLIGGCAPIAIYLLYTQSPSYTPMLYGSAFAIGALIGMEIPILIRINRHYTDQLPKNLSQILSLDYLGSLLGALVFVYVLLSRISLPRMAFALGLVNTAIAAIGALAFYRLLRAPRWVVGAIASVAAILTVGWLFADSWHLERTQALFQDPIVHQETSKYQHIVLTQREERVRLYLNGHLQFSSTDEAIYHDLLVHPALSHHAGPKRVLILGGGDGLALRDVLRYPSVTQITLVDIDPAVVALSQRHPLLRALNNNAFADARVHVHIPQPKDQSPQHQDVYIKAQKGPPTFDRNATGIGTVDVFLVDADRFLQGLPQEARYDVVLVDFPDPSHIETAKLFSQEFYATLRQHLAKDATIALQATSPYHAKNVFLSIGATLESAGFATVPYHQNVPSFGDWGFYLGSPCPPSKATVCRGKLRRALSDFSPKVHTRFLTPDVARASLAFGKAWLQPSENLDINTRLHPALLSYYRQAWRDY